MICDTAQFLGELITEFCACGHMIAMHAKGGQCEVCLVRSITVAKVEPGDVVVYHPPTRLKQTEMEMVWNFLRDLFPANKVGVMDEGGGIEIMRPEQ